ncbi:MAG TPA: hypothetical protein VFI17_03475 [Solirubrobacterales bacterium]|nr:hypothetical protein [Solirubrobacterales bacterium]
MNDPSQPDQPTTEAGTPSPREAAAINAGEEPVAASGTASATPSPLGSPFIAEPGPAFDAEQAPPGPEPQPQADIHALPTPEIAWEEGTVQDLLDVQGQLLHGAIGVADQDWLHTQADLKAIGGPLTRILNRYPATAAAAAMGDPVALALGLGAYGVRSTRERAEVLRAQAEEEVPITGVKAPPGAGPPEPGPHGEPGGVEWQIS